MWLVLLAACFRHQRVFIEQHKREWAWSGIVAWVTPWTVALRVSYDDNDVTHMVWLPIREIEMVRDFIPSAARQVLKDAYREDPPAAEGVKK